MVRDLILVGGGLANGLIAWRLRQRYPQLNLLLIEAGEQPGGNHTWSFHEDDLTPEQHAWLAPLVAHAWPGYEVQFPDLRRRLARGYYSITSERFAEALYQALGENIWLNCSVSEVLPNSVRLANGEALLAGAVIDGRGVTASSAMQTGYQLFLGQQWRLTQPHGLTVPILMDATVAQQQGYRFVYTLPLSADTLLIEDTRYANVRQRDDNALRQTVTDYAHSKGWQLAQLEREETGCLPITLAGDIQALWADAPGVPRSGMRAGLFHPTTGYSLPLAVALADAIADSPRLGSVPLYQLTRQFAERHWRRQGFFRLLNRMLFLAGREENRWRVMQRFYGLPEPTVERFYAGRLSLFDKARILTGKPPVPLGEAWRAALNHFPDRRDKG
ncbi:lycopene beta-cyclase CrtY [Buttiauxella sp. HR94]|nr:lycopene beta-cyclase CrtY [Buttiauxella sp. HR94]